MSRLVEPVKREDNLIYRLSAWWATVELAALAKVKAGGRGLKGFSSDAVQANKDNYLGIGLVVLFLVFVAVTFVL